MKVTKAFRASENGHTVADYQPGEYESLPPKALEHAKNIGALDIAKPKKAPKNKANKPEAVK